MIKTILTNDIKDILGHNPSKTEFASAYNYIKDNIDGTTTLVDIELLLRDWKSDCLTRCESCGNYFLTELMEERFIGTGFHMVCSCECAEELCNEWE